VNKEVKSVFKGFVIESGNAYTFIYIDETGMLRILQVWWEESAEKKVYDLESINFESEEISEFIKAIEGLANATK